MNRPCVRALAVVVLVVGAVFSAGGCGVGQKSGPAANNTDRERLATVQQDPTLRDATIEYAAGKPQTSSNIRTQRWTLLAHRSVAGLAGFEQWPADTKPATAEQWSLAQGLARELTGNGWALAAVTCWPNGTFSALAVKEFDGFTAAMQAGFTGDAFDQMAYIPFHTESANPWSPGSPMSSGTSCIEQTSPPAAQTAGLPGNNYSFGFGRRG